MGFPTPVRSKSLSPAPFKPTAGMHLEPIAVGRGIGGLLSAFPHPIPLEWGKTALAARKGVTRGRDSRSTLEAIFGLLAFFPKKYLAPLLPASELLQVLVSPRCPWTVLPSVRSGRGVIAPRKILSFCQEDPSQVLETLLWCQYVLLNRGGRGFGILSLHWGFYVQSVLCKNTSNKPNEF